jgi:probable rRNA maturation factor
MIYYHFETEEFELDTDRVTAWIEKVLVGYKMKTGEVNYIFCDDEYLLDLNVKYLNHNTLTDIISFDDSQGDEVQGDVFISVERVLENAQNYKVGFENELHRVMIHGILHFIGLKDKSEDEARLMREAENSALELLNQMN